MAYVKIKNPDGSYTGTDYKELGPVNPEVLFSDEADRWAAAEGFSKAGGIRTVFMGDSRTFLGTAVDKTGGVTFQYNAATDTPYYLPGAGAFASTADYGYTAWLDALMGAPHFVLKNAGVGGDNTDQMLARYQTDVIAYNPELVYLWGGYNDFNNGRSFEYVQANILQMLALNSKINAFTCLLDCPYTATVASNATRAAEATKFNRWLAGLARTRRDVAIVSASAVMSNPDFSVGGSRTNLLLTDLVHNNNLSAFRVAKAVAKVMTPIIRQWANAPFSPYEGWDVAPGDATKRIRNSNPLMAGTGGTAGTGVTGASVPTGYAIDRPGGTGGATAVTSKVPNRDSQGDAVRIATTFAAANDGIGIGIGLNGTVGPLSGNASGRLVPGNYLEGQVDVAFASDAAAIINRIEFYVGYTIGAQGCNTTAMRRVISSSDQGIADNIQMLPLAGEVMRLRTPRVLVPAGSAVLFQYFLRVFSGAAGAVTFDVSNFMVSQYAP